MSGFSPSISSPEMPPEIVNIGFVQGIAAERCTLIEWTAHYKRGAERKAMSRTLIEFR
jgi:hypothetical protein